MKHVFKLLVLAIFSACNQHDTVKEMPIDRVSLNSMDALEEKVYELEEKVKNIKVEKIKKGLPELKKVGFINRFQELKENLEKTISLIRPKYNKEERRKLKISYAETSVIYDYLVHEYQI